MVESETISQSPKAAGVADNRFEWYVIILEFHNSLEEIRMLCEFQLSVFVNLHTSMLAGSVSFLSLPNIF